MAEWCQIFFFEAWSVKTVEKPGWFGRCIEVSFRSKVGSERFNLDISHMMARLAVNRFPPGFGFLGYLELTAPACMGMPEIRGLRTVAFGTEGFKCSYGNCSEGNHRAGTNNSPWCTIVTNCYCMVQVDRMNCMHCISSIRVHTEGPARRRWLPGFDFSKRSILTLAIRLLVRDTEAFGGYGRHEVYNSTVSTISKSKMQLSTKHSCTAA